MVPARQRIIKDITNDDIHVQITGHVRDIQKDFLILDDESGTIRVDFKDVNVTFNKGDLINVFGDIDLKVGGEKILNAKIIQDMNKLNFKYYRKLYDLKKDLHVI